MTGKYQPGDEPVAGYRLEQFLGQGGFGQVWKVLAPGGTEAALKIISLSGKQGLKEFRALRLVKRARHPNLVPLMAYWLKDEQGRLLDDNPAQWEKLDTKPQTDVLLVETGTLRVEQAEGPRPVELIIAMGLGERDLANRLEECRREGASGIPWSELMGYMEDSARAIDYLNQPRQKAGSDSVAIQHCDIKPSNIMIVGGAAQVCDFGLARMINDVRKTATAAGTIAYVAPECLTQCQPSSATDQYSLAVTYVELRTGKLPYTSENFSDVMNAVLQGALYLSHLSEPEQVVIRRATATDPKKRFPTALEMVQSLRRSQEFADQRTATILPPPKRRSRAGSLIGLAALLIGCVVGAVYLWNLEQPSGGHGTGTSGLAGNSTPSATPTAMNTGTVAAVETAKPDQATKPTKPTPPDENQLLARATALFDEKKYDEALDAVNQAIKDLPRPSAKLLQLQAAVYLAKRELTSAIEAAGQALALEDSPQAHVVRGEAYFRSGDLVRAADDASQAITLDPNHAQAFLLRGTCFMEQQQHSSAINDLTQAIVLNGGDSRGYSRRGQAHMRNRETGAAIADFTKAIEIDHDPLDYVARAVASWNLDKNKVLDDLTEAVRRDPKLPDAYYQRALLRQEQQLWPKALEDFQTAVELSPRDKEMLINFANVLIIMPEPGLRDDAKAVELAKRACELTQWSTVEYLAILAAAQNGAGRFDDAINTIDLAIKAEPDAEMKRQYEELKKKYHERRTSN